jgi:regulator of protease activity HflC (stomatin/prohibitin superfamily)
LKQSEILRAEGDAQARVQKANAESEGIRLVSDAFKGTGDPTNHLIATRYIDTLSPMVSGKDNKVIYIPYKATGLLASLDGI